MDTILPKYLPILSVSPSEIRALSELPEKDKDQLLPYFPLKGWLSARKLENTIEKIYSSFKERPWIADIDYNFLRNSKIIKRLMVDGKYPREVYDQLIEISDSKSGYINWVKYISGNNNIIAALQLDDINELEEQCLNFNKIDNAVAVRIKINSFNMSDIVSILSTICNKLSNTIYVIIDLENVGYKTLCSVSSVSEFVNNIIKACSSKKNCYFSLSSTSFPHGFSGMSEGESTIYERAIFNKVNNMLPTLLIYSDYASVSLNRAGGAARIPPPRIDYPRKNEWKHLRKDFDDVASATKSEKHALYRELAIKLMKKEYWEPNLLVWGTQQIEKTALGDNFGITDAQKATATRINIHLFQQLHYNDVIDELDTDDEWID